MPRRPSAFKTTDRMVGRIEKKTGEFRQVMGRPRGERVRRRAAWEKDEYAARIAARLATAPTPAPKDLIALTSLTQINAERCKRRFRTFVEGAWSVLEPDTPFVPGWHIDAICEHLQAMEEDQLGDLLITVPPRRMKSLLASVFFPAWVWARHPESRFLYGSYSASLATMHSVFTRRVIESEWYQQRWGSVFQMTSDQNVKTFYENDKTGFRISVGVGGSATGRGGRFICCLPGHVPVVTDRGSIPIRDIVDRQLPVRILGSSGIWQPILEYERNPGRPCLEIITDAGSFQCTEDHPVYVEGRGFIPARELQEDSIVRHVRPANQIPSTTSILFQNLLGNRSAANILRSQSPDLSRMFSGVLKTPSSVLFEAMPRDLTCETVDGSSRQSIRVGDTRDSQESHQDARWTSVRRMSTDQGLASPSPRWWQDRSSTDQSRQLVYLVSPNRAYQNRSERRVDDPVRVRLVRRGPTPDVVYNLNVAPDHVFYAAGHLVHNCDDPHNVKETYSDSARQEAVDWWNKTMSTRVNPGAPGHRLVIMQRVHVKDVAGDVIAKGSYVHLNLPSEFVPSKKTVVWITQPTVPDKPQVLSTTSGGDRPKSPSAVRIFWEDPRQKPNDLLWSSTITPDIITQAKRDLGPYDYAAQHQQDPVPIGGGIVKRAWWRYWVPPGSPLIPIDVETEDGRIQVTPVELPHDLSDDEAKLLGVRKRQAFDESCMSVDCTFKNTDGSDYVVIQVWARLQARKYLLDQVRRRMGFQDTVKAVQDVFARWPRITYKFIEDTANGPAVIDSLRAKIPGIHPVNPQGGKVARVHAVTHTISAGDVYLPSPHIMAWVWDFLHEWDLFTPTGGGDHDDQVDATSQALSQLEKRSSVVPMAVL